MHSSMVAFTLSLGPPGYTKMARIVTTKITTSNSIKVNADFDPEVFIA